MLKWKSRTETTNIGVLELGNITFDEDYMEVSIVVLCQDLVQVKMRFSSS